MNNEIQPAAVPLAEARFIPSEINLNRLPFFASGTKGLKSKFIEYRDTIHLSDGTSVEILWQVSGDTKYGYPGPFAERVHHAIIEMAFEQGYPIQNPIIINLNELCRRLGLEVYNSKKDKCEVQSRDRKRVKHAIRSIRFAGIVCESAFRLHGDLVDLLDDDGVTLYKRSIFAGEKDGSGKVWKHTAIWFSEFLLESINHPYLRPVSLSLIDDLSKQAGSAPKLYKYLGYLFAVRCFGKESARQYVDVPYQRICKIIDVSHETALSLAKRKFTKAHNALIEAQIISSFEWIGEGPNTEGYKIRYRPGQRAREEYSEGPKALKRTFQLELFSKERQLALSGELESKLSAFGFDNKAISFVMKKYRTSKIALHIEYLEFELAKGTSIDNPAGWLRASIKGNFSAPKGFKAKSAREESRAMLAHRAALDAQKKALEEEEQKQLDATYQQLDALLAKRQDSSEIEALILKQIHESLNGFEKDYFNGKELDKNSPFIRVRYYPLLEEILSN